MIAVSDLAVRQGKFSLVGASLHVPQGEYAVLMGKSGCGKTTLLEAIAGLRPIASGSIVLAGRDVTRAKPAARNIGYVPQDGALFPNLSVRGNLSFALDVRKAPRLEIEKRAAELAEWLELAPLLDRDPSFLSGGEKQRVALGRALAARPPVLLLDEPLVALDDDARDHLIDWLIRLREARDVTVLHVTHNRTEAERLGDRVFRIEGGVVKADAHARR